MPGSRHSAKFVVIVVQTRDIRFRTRPKGRLMNVTVGKIADRAMHSLLPPINYLPAPQDVWSPNVKFSIIVPLAEEYLDKYPNKKARRAPGTFGKPFTRFIVAMEIITGAVIVLNWSNLKLLLSQTFYFYYGDHNNSSVGTDREHMHALSIHFCGRLFWYFTSHW